MQYWLSWSALAGFTGKGNKPLECRCPCLDIYWRRGGLWRHCLVGIFSCRTSMMLGRLPRSKEGKEVCNVDVDERLNFFLMFSQNFSLFDRYLDNTWPHPERGSKRPWGFCFSKHYWFPSSAEPSYMLAPQENVSADLVFVVANWTIWVNVEQMTKWTGPLVLSHAD